MKNKVLIVISISLMILLLCILTGCGKNETVKQDNKVNQEQKITAKNYGDKIEYSANGIDDFL